MWMEIREFILDLCSLSTVPGLCCLFPKLQTSRGMNIGCVMPKDSFITQKLEGAEFRSQ